MYNLFNRTRIGICTLYIIKNYYTLTLFYVQYIYTRNCMLVGVLQYCTGILERLTLNHLITDIIENLNAD